MMVAGYVCEDVYEVERLIERLRRELADLREHRIVLERLGLGEALREAEAEIGKTRLAIEELERIRQRRLQELEAKGVRC